MEQFQGLARADVEKRMELGQVNRTEKDVFKSN